MPAAVASPLGSPVPAHLPHAVSVSLPTWQDNVDYEEGSSRVVDVMKTGYPRFFIHRSILKLAGICEQKFGMADEKCLIFPCDSYAKACRDFMNSMDSKPSIRIVQFFICPNEKEGKPVNTAVRSGELHIALFPAAQWSQAKSFWQHTGMGISSRFADHCLGLLEKQKPSLEPHSPSLTSTKGRNRHYSSKHHRSVSSTSEITENFKAEEASYLEERYARNLPANAAMDAKKTLKRRIAGVILREEETPCHAKEVSPSIGPSTRRVPNISEDDVFLFPGGMCAIWHAHQLLMKTLGSRKSICWGFPYVDTLKILQKWGPGCHFFGNGNEFDELEALLHDLEAKSNGQPPVLALFCEVTSNPLLKTPDLRRLRALADKYSFAIVVDETIGNYANVEVLPYSDVVVSSLTKIFSGETNVMGGGMILNPQGRHYPKLKPSLLSFYEDMYWIEDAIFLERNSRDFRPRVYKINENAEAICELLYSRSVQAYESRQRNHSSAAPPAPKKDLVVKQVYYPKWVDTDIYNGLKTPEGGYGGLFSVTFTSQIAAKAFFDGLACEKGPSLGTNFTLACPFVILAHYTELDWVKQFGVDPYLVRVSVGLENREVLISWIEAALKNAEDAVRACATSDEK